MAETSSPQPFTLKVGTRRSALALKQVDLVVALLQSAHPHVTFSTHAVSVMGDRDKTTPLPALGRQQASGGKGLWTTELEAQLASGELDMVVHCVKDMPTTLPAGCALGAVLAREDPRDAVVFAAAHGSRYTTLADLPPGAVVGTSSVRRAAQLRRRHPGLAVQDVRGNVDTRLRKLDDPDSPFDCIILAAAGLRRMGLGDRIAQYLDGRAGMLYAVGQGALGIEVRDGDARVLDLLGAVADGPTTLACQAERSLMRTLEGGCSVPVGVETTWIDDDGPRKLLLKAVVVSVDGANAVEADEKREIATMEQADGFGRHLAEVLVERGAQVILDCINQDRPGEHGAVKVGHVLQEAST